MRNIEIGVRGVARVAKGLIVLSICCLASWDRWFRKRQHVTWQELSLLLSHD